MSETRSGPQSASHSRPQSRRHSRRSTGGGGTINFAQMSVTPLTSATLTEDDFLPGRSKHRRRRSGSYIQGTSAPTTPGILSRTPSSFRLHSPSLVAVEAGLAESKSSSQLARARGAHDGSSEWLHRTGAALSSGARESKGQGWLSTRASSTSLVRLDDAGEDFYYDCRGDNDECACPNDGEFSPASPLPPGMSPMWGMREEFDYFGAHAISSVGKGEEGAGEGGGGGEEEEEYYRHLRGGYRLGQIIDRLIGWSLFADDDDDDDSADDDDGGGDVGDDGVYRRKPRERLRLLTAEDQEKLREEQRLRRDQDGGWQDPAWIFSIASNVLF